MNTPNPTTSRTPSLFHHHDFRHLWLADAFSAIGSRLSLLAIPLLALLTLNATALEVSLLRTVETLAALFLGLIAGAWMDRIRCRGVLIAADLTRAVLLASIPVAAIAGFLSLTQLFIVVGAAGVATVFFDVGSTTYVPRLMKSEQLVDANSKLAMNHSVGAVLASGAGGFIIQLLTAPIAIAFDAVTYLWSALWLRGIRHREDVPIRTERSTIRADIAEGVRFVWGHPILRCLAGYSICTIFFQSMESVLGIVLLAKVIGLSPGWIGLIGMSGLLGAIAAGLVVGRIVDRIGLPRTMWIAALIYAVGFAMFPMTTGGWGLIWNVAGGLAASFAIIAMHVAQVSTRQMVCPPHLYGRVGATMEFTIWGVMPVGSLVGGVIATVTDVRTTLWIVAGGITISILWIIASPLRTIREIAPVETPAAPTG